MSCGPADKGLWTAADNWTSGRHDGAVEVVAAAGAGMPFGRLKCLVSSSSVQLLEPIGTGAMGVVHRAEWTIGSAKVITIAARVIRTGQLSKNESVCDKLVDRLNAMSELRHASIIRMFGIVSRPSEMLLLSEYAELGCLKTFLRSPPSDLSDRCAITVAVLVEYAVQIAHGLSYLESRSVVHADLTACNVMRTPQQVKIRDCGVLWLLPDCDVIKQRRTAWHAPETLNSGVFTHACDRWMYAVVLWELFSLGADPWLDASRDQVVGYVNAGRQLPRPSHCPQSVYNVMSRCWALLPDERPRMTAVIDALNKVALPELTAGRDFSEPGKLSVKNGDVIIVTRSGSDLWEGQNKRTGEVGEFPEIVFTLLPLRAASAETDGHKASSVKQKLTKSGSGKNVLEQPLIDLSNLASSCLGISAGGSDEPAKQSATNNWVTFESTTDLRKTDGKTEVASQDAGVDRDADVSRLNGNVRDCSELRSDPDRLAVGGASSTNVDFDVQIDVPDSILLLPAMSQTSISEPCSPAHGATGPNPDLLVTSDNACFMDDGLCHSLPSSNMSERLSWMTTSASCENLNSCAMPRSPNNGLCSRAQFAEHLSKASSDSPIFVAGAAGNAPPVPPRDYPSRRRCPPESAGHGLAKDQPPLPLQHTEIHPILQDGQRRSSTHYWLLPEKQRFEAVLTPSGDGAEPISYVNVPDGSRPGREKASRKHGGKTRHTPPASSSSETPSADEMAKNVAESPEPLGDIQDKVEMVRVEVGEDAVTHEESFTALAASHWSVDEAVRYIKVEHLFRLGIAPRSACRKALVSFQWDLQNAAAYLVDRQSSSSDPTH